MRARVCKYPGCFLTTEDKYCNNHKQHDVKEKAIQKDYYKPQATPYRNAERPNAYLYNTSKWRKLRNDHIDNNPYCVSCGDDERGNLTVDHIVAPKGNEDLFFDAYNLQTLCKTCHNIKTSIEVMEMRKGNKSC